MNCNDEERKLTSIESTQKTEHDEDEKRGRRQSAGLRCAAGEPTARECRQTSRRINAVSRKTEFQKSMQMRVKRECSPLSRFSPFSLSSLLSANASCKMDIKQFGRLSTSFYHDCLLEAEDATIIMEISPVQTVPPTISLEIKTFARGQVRPSSQKDDVMADDGLGDLLGDMDDLDNALFGRSTGPKTKPSLGNLDSLFGDTKKPAAKKSTVSFLDTPTTSASGASHPPTKSTLDELFADTSSDQKSAAASASTSQATNKPSRLQSGSTSLGNLLGPSRREKETKPGPSVEQTAPVQAAQISAVVAPEDALRTKRLENEVERLNREIEDLKRRKKDDEQDIEKLWKEKLAKKDREHQDEIKDLETAQQKQLSKLENEHTEEIDRLRTTYERQLETIQQSASQWRDVSSVVDKVDSLSTTINQLANNVTTATERALLEKETELRLKEQKLESMEQSLLRDKAQFEDERKKVYELNAKLNELCRGQETVMEQDKYRVREEWNRLNAEKAVFKEDQRFILENIEKQKAALDKSKTAFLQEQHDLLVRVSTERQLLEQERNEFHGKRSIDVRRLKEEAGELQRRAQNVLAAERQVDELKTRYETKMRQLQELEITLMEECVEMENLRNQMSTVKVRPVAENGQGFERPTADLEQDFALTQVGKDVPAQNESVRTVLKKHSEFLERYMGQKVAAVAPRPARFDSP